MLSLSLDREGVKMKNLRSFILCFLVLILGSIYGCVQMRDYTGVRDGSFGLDINKGFDQGVDRKDYYMISEDVALIVSDTKNDVIFKIGLPAKTNIELDGYESWSYEDRRIDLFFKGDRLRSWSSSRYEEAEVQEEK